MQRFLSQHGEGEVRQLDTALTLQWLKIWRERMHAGGLLANNFRSPGHDRNNSTAVAKKMSKATLFTPRDLFWAFAGEKGFITQLDFQQVIYYFFPMILVIICAGTCGVRLLHSHFVRPKYTSDNRQLP